MSRENSSSHYRILLGAGFLPLLFNFPALANPTSGTVTQGSATFSSSGSTFNINQTSANALINWQSFNIGVGETVNFNQPTASSLTFNQINDSNPSQILGNLNANGYVVLENANGFYVGGQAAITAHGLIMTTAVTPTMDLFDGGPWSFNAPPPAAKIQNYGQINVTGGGTAYLIAADVVNGGTINAPSGHIGLYDGEAVLVSMSPNGQGLNAEVTLPQGSVDNEGKLTALGGSIVAQAQFVNQNGIIQADTAENVNGTIELVASSSVALGANSTISAQGGAQGISSGGSVTIQAGDTFSDQAGSTISVAGGAQGGNGGQMEISAPQMGAINTVINGQAQDGFTGGTLTVDPADIWLDSANTAPSSYTFINISSFSGLSQINLQASDDIVLNTSWGLANQTAPATLSLSAGNDIILENNSSISAGNNWAVNLTAGTAYSGAAAPPSGSDGIYLNGSAYIQSQNGNINLLAANEVQVGWSGVNAGVGTVNTGTGSINTYGGGSIDVTTLYGDVNAGSGTGGFTYESTAPYYRIVSLGGISTGDGGNVTITAENGNVISYTPSSTDSSIGNDPGTGAFGTASGNVTITAGDNVYGHYVLANGVGIITAINGDVGTLDNGNPFALSLIDGSWAVNAPDGNIYLTEVRNPNGDYNNAAPTHGHPASSFQNLFTYGADAEVDLTAGDGVYLTDTPLPRNSADPVQVIYPPILDITAGAGGVMLGGNVTLFPSVDQNLEITTTDGGSLVSGAPAGTTPELLMSDSSATTWVTSTSFSDSDNGDVFPTETQPVEINISGNIGGPDLTSSGVNIITTKETDITVGGDIINSGFEGQNLSVNDVTSINVTGQIYDSSPYSFDDDVSIPSIPASDLPSGVGYSWDNIFILAIIPSKLVGLTLNSDTPPSQYVDQILQRASLFGVTFSNGQLSGNDQGFSYDSATKQIAFAGPMSSTLEQELTSGTLTILHLANGQPVIDENPTDNNPGRTYGQYEYDTVSWAPTSAITTLYTESQGAPSPYVQQLGFQLGGPGEFDITADSISLGNAYGILSCGVVDPSAASTPATSRYADLAPLTPSGATINVTVTGPDTSQGASLNMLSSSIAALDGGDVNLTSTHGSMDLGVQELLGVNLQNATGVYTTGGGNVNVMASGDVNIDGSRIATYNGGDIFVESLQGSINVGSGSSTLNPVYVSYVDPVSGQAATYLEDAYGSGIIANTLVPVFPGDTFSWPPNVAKVPGNITVETPEGNIVSTLGGIVQVALDGSIAAGPTITLTAGTFPSGNSPGYTGNIDLGDSGVIGGTVNLQANGNIIGQIISRQNSNVNASQNFSGTLLAAGSANVTGGGTVSGTIVGVGGVNVSGTGGVSASLLGQNVSVNGGTSQDTLGSSATATSSTQSAAQQASSQSQQQVAADQTTQNDNKKKKAQIRTVGHVTVILATAQ